MISINQTGGASAGCSSSSFQTITVVVSPTLTPTPYSVCQNGAVPSGQGLSVPSVSAVTTINGTITTSSPSYLRPNGDNVTVYVPGSNVLYKVYYFIAPSSGSFTFATTAGTITDTYISLYQNSFDPANPATNFVRGDDDVSGTVFFSSLTQTLTAGTTYILVVSGWSPSVTGTFTMTSSPGISLQANQWYAVATGGTPLFTGRVFNPVGIVGSGVSNTSTVGTTTFYVNDLNTNSACRYPVNFNIGSVGGTITADVATACSVSNAGTMTLSGNAGAVVRWESSTDNFVTNTPITNTTTTLNYTNLTQTTQYRAVVQFGTCDPVNSSPVTITVNNSSVAGIVTGNASVCSTANTGILTLTGYTGSITGWESSTDNFATSTPVTNITATQNFTNLTQNTQYRAVVQNGSCTASNSTPATITVANLLAGTVTGSTAECASGNAGTLLLTGSSGNILRWESSTDNFTTTTTIANTGIVQSYTNLTLTTQYRTVIGLSGCTNVNSPTATITVSPVAVGGTVSANLPIVCLGTPINLTLTGSTGTVTGWQVSNNNFASVTNINNTTTALTSTPNQSVSYRVALQSGVCPLVFSGVAGVLVTTIPTIATPTVTQPTCTTQGTIVVNTTGVGSTIINGTLTTGDAVQTNRLNRNGITSGCGTPKVFPNTLAATGIIYDKYTFTNPSASPVCISVTLQTTNGANMNAVLYSSPFDPTNISTNYLADFGVIGGFQTTYRHTVAGNATVDVVVSSTTSVVANLGAYRLSIDGLTPLEYSVNNGTTWQTSNTFSGLATGTYNLLARSAPANTNTCSVALGSNPVTLSVQGSSVGGTVASSTTVCGGINSGTVTLSGQTGNVVRWESSTDNFVSNIVSITNTTTTLNYSNLAQTTQYRAVVKSGICAEVNSSVAVITVLPASPVPVASGATTILVGSSVTLTSTGCMGVGLAEKWYKTSDNSLVTMPVSPTVTTSYYARCEQTSGATICLSGKSNDVLVTVVSEILSIISGNWEDSTTWNIGRIPAATEDVIINNNHEVTINTTVSAKNVQIKTNAKIIHGTASSKLQTGI